jgi:hypothetical protein
MSWGTRGPSAFSVGVNSHCPKTKKKIFVLPFMIVGELGVDLNELPPLRLEVVDCETLRVLLQPIKVHKLLHCEVMLLAQSHGPQNHTPEESSPGVGR